MFQKVVVVSSLVLLAAATPAPWGTTAPPASSCNTGNLQCCQSTQSASSSGVASLASLLGIVLGPVSGLAGLTCSPISAIGLGGTSCTAQPVCCTGNNFSGLIVLGCSPVNLGL